MLLPLTVWVGFFVYFPACTAWQTFQDMDVFLRLKENAHAFLSYKFACPK